MGTAARLDHQHLWHPFTQQREWVAEGPLVIESAEGTELIDVQGKRYLDGVSSLWCNVHGHRHPAIDAAIRDQLDRVAHTTLLGLASPPGPPPPPPARGRGGRHAAAPGVPRPGPRHGSRGAPGQPRPPA